MVGNLAFDSRAEASRYHELKLMESAGQIDRLTVHPKYPLTQDGLLVATYTADFRYFDYTNGWWVVEDVKGVDTEASRLRRKWLKACANVDVVLIKRASKRGARLQKEPTNEPTGRKIPARKWKRRIGG